MHSLKETASDLPVSRSRGTMGIGSGPEPAVFSAATVAVRAQVRREALIESVEDQVAAEVPVALLYNGEPHVVMMATPADFEDFARGFSVTERIVGTVEELMIERVTALDESDEQAGFRIAMRIPLARHAALAQKRRTLEGRSGCGLCGAREIAEALHAPAHVPAGSVVSAGALRRALEALRGQQPANAVTGATHAAAWATPDGILGAVREDVGRHNALDKLIGHLLASGVDRARGFALVTSRASYELVQKAASVGITMLVAISAPTAYAVRMAEDAGLTLVGFARGERHVVYSCPGRLVAPRS